MGKSWAVGSSVLSKNQWKVLHRQRIKNGSPMHASNFSQQNFSFNCPRYKKLLTTQLFSIAANITFHTFNLPISVSALMSIPNLHNTCVWGALLKVAAFLRNRRVLSVCFQRGGIDFIEARSSRSVGGVYCDAGPGAIARFWMFRQASR